MVLGSIDLSQPIWLEVFINFSEAGPDENFELMSLTKIEALSIDYNVHCLLVSFIESVWFKRVCFNSCYFACLSLLALALSLL